MSLRIRQVKPDFWRDSTVAVMADSTRLAYIGMWMEADDAGWLRLNLTEIAADLYPLTARALRERRVGRAIEELTEAGRIERHDCGHALVPNLVRHQRFASMEKRVHTIEREHMKCLGTEDPRVPAVPRASPPRSGGVTTLGKEREGGVSGGNAARSMPIRINDDGTFEAAPLAASGAGQS